MTERIKEKKDSAVLFVDDEEFARETLQRIFQKDFTLFMASGGEEGMEIIKAHPEIRVLVTDLRMPKMDGIELARQVASEAPRVVSILLTAYADISLIVNTMKEGVLHRYIAKPYDARILKQEIVQGIQWNALIKERDDCNVERMALKKELAEIKKDVV